MNSKISHLFSFHEIPQTAAVVCSPNYKDILILRRNKKIIGMAKISFECLKHQMIGERYNDSNFGKSGEFKELQKILHQ